MTDFVSPEPIHVVAAVIRDAAGRVLLTQRPIGKDLAGLWEFPGGKCESGEPARFALARELDEELGIQVDTARSLMRVPHTYADKSIVLDCWDVQAYSGTAWSREGQALRWLHPQEMDRAHMPAADHPLITALRLPQRYLITPAPAREAIDLFLADIQRALQGGIRLLQLRLPGWPRADVAALARRLRDLCAPHGAELLLSADWQLAEVLGLAGVHLPARIAASLDCRPVAADRWLGVSCHSAEELLHAQRIGADFATLSPIRSTPSHPDAAAMGWQRAASLIAACALPVYALGGLDAGDLELARTAGAQGVAAMRGFLPGR